MSEVRRGWKASMALTDGHLPYTRGRSYSRAGKEKIVRHVRIMAGGVYLEIIFIPQKKERYYQLAH